MKVIRCKTCGHELMVEDDVDFIRCDSCGSYNEIAITIPKGTIRCIRCNTPLDAKNIKDGVLECSHCKEVMTFPKGSQSANVKEIIELGKNNLDICNFDEAYKLFSRVIELDSKEPEGYFNRALARYQIQYLRDFDKNRMQPICHIVNDKKFSEDNDYIKALQYASDKQKKEYQRKAIAIDEIKKEFLRLEKQNINYDCFLCVKVSDNQRYDSNGKKLKTEDANKAYQLYNLLAQENYSPFYSEAILTNYSGEAYEAHILYALHKAKCMLIVCSDESYLDTPWVKNEYMRWKSFIESKEKEEGSITIVYLDKPIEHIPTFKQRIQSIDYNSLNNFGKICAFINKYCKVVSKLQEVKIKTGKVEKIINTQRDITSSVLEFNNVKKTDLSFDAIVDIIKSRISNQDWDNALDKIYKLEMQNKDNGELLYLKALASLKIESLQDLTPGKNKKIEDGEYNQAYLKKILENANKELGEQVLSETCLSIENVINKFSNLRGFNRNDATDFIEEYFNIGVYNFSPCIRVANLLVDLGVQQANYCLFKLGDRYNEDAGKSRNNLIQLLKNLVDKSNFEDAQKVINDLDQMVEGNVTVLEYKLFVKYRVHTIAELFMTDFNDFESLRDILQYCQNEDEVCLTVSEWINNIINVMSKQKLQESSYISLFNHIEEIIKFMPEQKQRNTYQVIAKVAKKLGVFDLATKYYLINIQNNENDVETYFELIQCENKCRSEDELLKITNYISDSEYYADLINASKNDATKLQYYKDFQTKQAMCVKKNKEKLVLEEKRNEERIRNEKAKEEEEKQKLKEEQRKRRLINKENHQDHVRIFITALTPILVAASLFFLLTDFVDKSFQLSVLICLFTIVFNLIFDFLTKLSGCFEDDNMISSFYLVGFISSYIVFKENFSSYGIMGYVLIGIGALLIIYLIVGFFLDKNSLYKLFSLGVGFGTCFSYISGNAIYMGIATALPLLYYAFDKITVEERFLPQLTPILTPIVLLASYYYIDSSNLNMNFGIYNYLLNNQYTEYHNLLIAGTCIIPLIGAPITLNMLLAEDEYKIIFVILDALMFLVFVAAIFLNYISVITGFASDTLPLILATLSLDSFFILPLVYAINDDIETYGKTSKILIIVAIVCKYLIFALICVLNGLLPFLGMFIASEIGFAIGLAIAIGVIFGIIAGILGY